MPSSFVIGIAVRASGFKIHIMWAFGITDMIGTILVTAAFRDNITALLLDFSHPRRPAFGAAAPVRCASLNTRLDQSWRKGGEMRLGERRGGDLPDRALVAAG